MEEQFQNTATTTTVYNEEEQASILTKPDSLNPKGEEIALIDEEEEEEAHMYFQDIDSSCSTPFVSAPSSPGRGSPLATGGGGGFFYSAPASPMHFVFSSSSMHSEPSVSSSYEFEFSARFGMSGTASGGGSMSSADELFLNGQIRPMKLSSHLQRPQALEPLLDLDESEVNDDDDDDNDIGRGRDIKWRNKSLRRRTRSMSPLRTPAFQWYENTTTMKTEITEAGVVEDSEGGTLESKHDVDEEEVFGETNPSMSASSSRSSSASRSSKRWVFLKDFLYRSKSEGRNNGHKFWSSISFSPVVKDRKGSSTSVPSCESATTTCSSSSSSSSQDMKKKKKVVKQEEEEGGAGAKKKKKGVDIPSTSRIKATNGGVGGGKRRIQVLSPHEVHYKASRAQAEELRKKTFLPYRQGLLGCLGFSSKGYGAINGFARALNPVSSR